ncbi:MAG: hypothetical protein ACI3V1_05590 [Faecousia sp.]
MRIAQPLDLSGVSRTRQCVLRGLGQRLNKQKTICSTKAEWMVFRICITDALLAAIVKAMKNSLFLHFLLAASNAYGAPYAKKTHFRHGGFERFLLVGKAPKPFESQVPCELRT